MGLALKLLELIGPWFIKFMVWRGWTEEQAKLYLARVHRDFSKAPSSTLPSEAEAEQLQELEEKLKPKEPKP